MACFKTTKGRLIEEGVQWAALPGETIIPGLIDWHCGKVLQGDSLRSGAIFTPEGIMIGNLVKKVATKLGFKHCMSCQGRQRRLNDRGLKLQRKVKRLLRD